MIKVCPIFGAIGGDIMGSTYEFDNCKRKDVDLCPRGATFTDDSIMTIATADAILAGDISPEGFRDKYQKWGRKIPQPTGGLWRQFQSVAPRNCPSTI